MLAAGHHLDFVLAEIAAAGRRTPLVVVPGGGPFADAVRDADRLLGLGDDAAHWMAILAMDQYAHVLCGRMPDARLVESAREIDLSVEERRHPVLAPYRWLREADPLPHSWDVTSDSIAAWVAGMLGAERLVVVKAPGASGPALVDPCFTTHVPSRVRPFIIAADRLDELRAALGVVRAEP